MNFLSTRLVGCTLGAFLAALRASGAVLCVSQQSTNPIAPYVDWDTAATNIQDAVAAAVPHDTVLVTNGVYSAGRVVIYGTMGNRVALTNGIMLSSVNGPEVTTIAGGSQTRCVYVGSNSVVSGFTLTGGQAGTSGDAIREMSGGGAWCEAGGAVTNCVIRGNSAPNNTSGCGGGGAYGGTFYNCSFSGNYGLQGGGVRSGTLWSCTLAGNTAVTGGAAYSCMLSNCVVASNSALLSGGYVGSGGGTSFGTNWNCTIVSNLCTGNPAGNQAYGGGTYRSDNYSCLITGNSSLRGGGAYSGTHGNCTVIGNTANDGGGIHANDSPGGAFTNCIIYFNSSPGGINNWSGGVFDYCCTWPLPGGSGNITNDPGLVDWQNGLYGLKCGSPCVDTGRDLGALFGTDLRGKPRPLDGNGDSVALWDRGAYEYDAAVDAVPLIQTAFTNFTTQFPASFRSLIGGCASSFWWDFGDGSLVTNQASTVHAWSVPGPYEVRLTAYFLDIPRTLATTCVVQVLPQQIHYVDAGNATAAFPYTNWPTAATNIQDAITAGQIGDIVLVTNGVYGYGGAVVYGQQTNRIAATNPITVQSVNGPAVTLIRGGTQTRCAYLGGRVVLRGFTLTNGVARNGGDALREMSGGGLWCEPDAVVDNCIIISNSAPNTSSGGGGGVYGGRLFACTLSGNSGYIGAGARSCVLSNCALAGNGTIGYGNGGGAANCTLYSCLVSNNSSSAYGGGGGAYQSLLFNCLVTRNSTTARGGGATGSGGGTSMCTNYNCTLRGNLSGSSGGGAYLSTNYNCVIVSNIASYNGGGAYAGALINCTVVGNIATNAGGGFYGNYGSDRANNSILYYNSAPSGANYSGGYLYYTCALPPAIGIGNIGSEPLFVDAAGDCFQLGCGSPCIDAGGTNSFINGTTDDIRGVVRPVDGNADGSAKLDLGAYEYNPATDQTVAIRPGFKNASIITNYSVGFTAQLGGCPTFSWWDFGDSTVVSNQSSVSHAWRAPGLYRVQLSASFPGLGQTLSATTQVQVLELVHFVNAANASPVFPYTNWAQAATSIQQAIGATTNSPEAQAAGTYPVRRILVTNGTYRAVGPILYGSTPNAVALTNPVVVQSVNGAQATTIGPSANVGRCAYVGANAMLIGFTLANGRATISGGDALKELSGGGVWCEPSGVVRDCVLTGSQANRYGGGVYQGTLYNCLITNNTGGYLGATAVQGGGAFGATLYNCSLVNNSALGSGGGGGAAQCTLSNCTLSGNTAGSSGSGGGALLGSLYNCRVATNTAYNGAGIASNTAWGCVLIGNSASWQGGGAHGCTLYNCTVAANTANSIGASGGGGVYGSAVRNGIVYFNALTGGYSNSSSNYASSTFSTSWLADPLFVNLAAGDLHLRLGSPCIDLGVDYSASLSSDLDGKPRMLDGDGDGVAAFDFGAYEFNLLATVGTNWLIGYGLNPSDPLVFAADPDGDGFTTLQEWIADTSPVNTNSFFQVRAISNGPPVAVSFLSSSSRLYTLWSSTNLPAAWAPVPTQVNIQGNGGSLELQDTNGLPAQVYRVSVTVP
jgi:hypothetical protein